MFFDVKRLLNTLPSQPTSVKTFIAISLDFACSIFSVWVAFYLRLGNFVSLFERGLNAVIFSILISIPIDRGLIFIAKWVSGFLFISVTQFVIFVPFFKLLLLEFPENTLLFLSTTLFINIAIMAVANLISGIVLRSKFSEILLPLLLFPLLSPIAIAATRISNSVMVSNYCFNYRNFWSRRICII